MIKTIVIATDGSSHARKAATIGAAIASKFEARVVVLHVLMRSASYQTIYEAFQRGKLPTKVLDQIAEVPVMLAAGTALSGPVMPPIPVEALVQLGEHYLADAKSILVAGGITKPALMIGDGDPAERILSVAKRENADFIILGHRGLGALQEMLAGSVSTKVGHHAPCTVVSVK